MRNYSVAELAETDLKEIARHILSTEGTAESKKYIQGLCDCFQLVADDPTMGWQAAAILPGLRGVGYNKHMFVYATEEEGVRIVRILPSALFQLPTKGRG
jgi:toxin ParE1/3/4